MKESSNPLYNSFIEKYEGWHNTIIEIVKEPINKYIENKDILDGVHLREDAFVKNINKNKKIKITQSHLEQCSVYDYENDKIFSFTFKFYNDNDLKLIKIDINYTQDNKQNSKIKFFRLEKRNDHILYELYIDDYENSFKISGSDNEKHTDFSLYLKYEKNKNYDDFINLRNLATDDMFYEQSILIKNLAKTNPELLTEVLFKKEALNEELIEIFKLSNDIDLTSLLKISFNTDHEYKLQEQILKENNKSTILDFIKKKMRF